MQYLLGCLSEHYPISDIIHSVIHTHRHRNHHVSQILKGKTVQNNKQVHKQVPIYYIRPKIRVRVVTQGGLFFSESKLHVVLDSILQTFSCPHVSSNFDFKIYLANKDKLHPFWTMLSGGKNPFKKVEFLISYGRNENFIKKS